MKMPKLYSVKDEHGVVHIIMGESILDVARQFPKAIEILEKSYTLTASAINMINRK